MKKNKKHKDGGSLFLTMPFGGSVANSPIIPGQLPDYQMGSNVNSGVIQNNLRDIYHYYGNNFPYMAEGGDMEDESGATDSFYSNKVNGFIDKVRGTAQKNLESNLLKEAMREMRGDDETVEYGPQDMSMAQYGQSVGDQQNTYDPSTVNIFANAYGKAKTFTNSLQDFAKMNRIIQPTTEYQKIKRKFDLGFTDRFKEDNPWVNDDGSYKNVTRASFQNGGTLIPMFQGDDDESTVDFWSPEEMAYLQSLPKKQRDAIISKGDAAAKQQVQGVVKSKQPTAPVQPQVQPQAGSNNSSGTGTQSVTANNTTVNTVGAGSTPAATTTTTGPAATTVNTSPFEGYKWHTDANGNKYIVTPEGQLYSPYAAAASSDNVYTPQEYYTPYNTSADRQTYSYSERNKLTPEFREAMRSGALNNPNPQVIGRPHIEYRKALFPKNRNKEIKSISWQYGNMYGNPFDQGVDLRPDPVDPNVTPNAAPVTTTGPGANPSTSNLTPEQKVQQAMDFTFRPGQGPYSTPIDFPGLEKPKVGPWADYDEPQPTSNGPSINPVVKPTVTTAPTANVDPNGNTIPAGYVWNPDLNTIVQDSSLNTGTNSPRNNPSSSTNPNDWRNYEPVGIDYTNNDVKDYFEKIKVGEEFDTKSKTVTAEEAKEKQKIIDQTSKLPRALQMQVKDAVFNTSMDPRLDLMYAAGVQGADGLFLGMEKTGVDANGKPIQKTNPKLRKGLRDNKAEIDRLWNDPKTQALITQQYTDDPEAFTSAFGDQRKVSYSRMEQINGNPGIRYPGWAGRVDNTTNNWDTFDNIPANQMDKFYNTIISDNEQRYGQTSLKKKEGGSLHRFVQKYQQPIGSGVPGTVPDFGQTMDDYFDQEYDNSIDLGVTDMFGKPMSYNLSRKGSTTDLGFKNLSGEPIITDASREVRQDRFRGIKNAFNTKEEYKDRKKRDPWKAIRNINLATAAANLDETLGLEDQLKKFTQASEAFADVGNNWGQYNALTGQYMGAKGKQPPVINTGFAQYGGSLYDNLKQGDEIYLTQGQIDELLKRGVKLSYLD